MSQEFHNRYHLLDEVVSGTVRTHHAMAATGAVVMVHFLDDAASVEGTEIIDLLQRLDDTGRARVLEVLELEGVTVIVTRFILEFESLRSWLRSQVPAAAAPPITPASTIAPPELPPAEGEGPGEFTRLFMSPAVEPESLPPPEPPVATGEDDAPETVSEEPGEFTRLFAVPAVPPAPSETPVAIAEEIAPQIVSEGAAPEPGEFTRLFATPAVPSSLPEPDRPEPEAELEPEPEPEPEPELEPEPGEFTRLFATPTVPLADSAESAVQPELTVTPESTVAPESAVEPAENRSTPAGPGEFTRLFSRPDLPGSAPTQPPVAAPLFPPSPPPAPRAGGSWNPGAGGDSYLDRLHSTVPPRPPAGVRPPSATPPSAAPAAVGEDPLFPGLPPLGPLPPLSPPATPSGPSEFTRVLAGPALAPPVPPPVPPLSRGSEAPGGEKKPSTLPLLIGLGAVLLLACVLLLYFALKG